MTRRHYAVSKGSLTGCDSSMHIIHKPGGVLAVLVLVHNL
jgi:hypothetical protein